MELIPEVSIKGCGIQVEDILVFGDLHLGIEEEYNLPKTQFREIKEIIGRAIDNTKVSEVILNGDIKHEFGRISKTEWKDVLDLIDFIQRKCSLKIIEGNHDIVLQSVVKKKEIKLLDRVIIGDTAIIHGDEIIDLPKNIKTIIIGHDHPAIELIEGVKKEKYKCYLLGKFEGKNLIVMPSTNQVTTGTNVLKEVLLSPYLKNIKDFEVFVITSSFYDSEVLQFGKVKDLNNKFIKD